MASTGLVELPWANRLGPRLDAPATKPRPPIEPGRLSGPSHEPCLPFNCNTQS